jgi:YD repeat-containing protein
MASLKSRAGAFSQTSLIQYIETRDYVSTSLFNANYAQYDERGFVRGTFQLQETDGSTPSSVDPGRETSYVYDILGNKIRQTDDSGHSMAWSYNTAADGSNQPNLTINRLTSATSTAAGGNSTTPPPTPTLILVNSRRRPIPARALRMRQRRTIESMNTRKTGCLLRQRIIKR